MLNKPLIHKWVDALRSGEFSQTKQVLGKVEEDGSVSYCCLGVLCEVALADGMNINREVDPYHHELRFDGVTGIPGWEVAVYAGLQESYDEYVDPWTVPLSDATSRFTGEDESGDTVLHIFNRGFDDPRIGLADMNDFGNATFAEIADAIEQGYLKGEN